MIRPLCFWIAILLLECRSVHSFSRYVTRHQRPSSHLFASKKIEMSKLRVAIVGGGPSGLLLGHRLAQSGSSVVILEGRPRPKNIQLGKAYALGIGKRGRTAIQSASNNLWEKVKTAGFSSERFRLHLGPLKLLLRSAKDGGEPSVLLYQSDLCRVMSEELESHANVDLRFEASVRDVDLKQKTLTTAEGNRVSFDLVVGADGVNSVVRQAMVDVHPSMHTNQTVLPGVFKVVCLPEVPPQLDSTSVALVLPKSGGVSAFLEPTVNGTCCILFAGRNESDTLLCSDSVDETMECLVERFPILAGGDLKSAATQLVGSSVSRASSVVCNTYHYNDGAVLIGDAAHATGGVSGQGVNSALVDAAVLADSLLSMIELNTDDDNISFVQAALLRYSQQQVPEGHALYDLSFGPSPASLSGRLGLLAKTTKDFIFRGRWGIGEPLLQTQLTTSLSSFESIRRSRNSLYTKDFPDPLEWKQRLVALDKAASS